MPFFPGLGAWTTFVRQAAHLSAVKSWLHGRLAPRLGIDTAPVPLMDGCPLPICHRARAKRGKLLREVAAVGYCATKEEYDRGLQGLVVISQAGSPASPLHRKFCGRFSEALPVRYPRSLPDTRRIVSALVCVKHQV